MREPTIMELRVARRIFETMPRQTGAWTWGDLHANAHFPTWVGRENIGHYLDCIKSARVAIRTMQEPTKDMLVAASQCVLGWDSESQAPSTLAREDAAQAWSLMIDAASPPEDV